MSDHQSVINRIKVVLKDNPRGLTIGEISEKININRNSVSKYLEIMLVSGEVDMKSIGRAKLFYLSQRIPISAMLDFYSDHVTNIANINGKLPGDKKRMLRELDGYIADREGEPEDRSWAIDELSMRAL